MNNVSRLAILFAGFIVTGVFLNIYLIAAIWILSPVLVMIGIKGDFQVYSPIYWVCLAAGAVTAFFIMRPAWNAVGKKAPIKGGSEVAKADNSP